jgi:5-methylcytosine-specific restriction protein A
MKIEDLPEPVTASKADWLPGTTWLGFTPQGKGPNAEAQCQSTVVSQFGNGYVLERITQSFGDPNPAYADDPDIVAERQRHEGLKGRLVDVHKLRQVYRPLVNIIGQKDFERLQDMWGKSDSRKRWSVAFPIVESFEIVGKPHAREVFGDEMFRRIYQSQSAVLRPLDDEARAAIAGLEIRQVFAPNAIIAIEDEFVMANRSELPKKIERLIHNDMDGALEGQTVEQQAKIRRLAVWLADKFVKQRAKAGTLRCDNCGFDPVALVDGLSLNARSCFDVHHRFPLDEGIRYTTIADFSLLCPMCHRIEHLRMKV